MRRRPLRRKLAGLVAGMIVALITIMTAEAMANKAFNGGLPADLSATVPSAQQPTDFLLMVLLGWFLGGLLGGGLALYISRSRPICWGVAAVILIGIALRFVTESQPAWMFVAGPVAPLLGAWLAQLVGARRAAVERRMTGD